MAALGRDRRQRSLRHRQHAAGSTGAVIQQVGAGFDLFFDGEENEVGHEAHGVARRPMLARLLVVLLVEPANQLLEDRPHGVVVHAGGREVNAGIEEHVDQRAQGVVFGKRGNLVPELEVIEDVLDVGGEAVEVVLEIGEQLLLAAARGEVAQGELRSVVERLASGRTQGRILGGDLFGIEHALGAEHRLFGGLEHGIEAPENAHGQDDVLVFASLEEVAQDVVGDAPDEGNYFVVSRLVQTESPFSSMDRVHERRRRAAIRALQRRSGLRQYRPACQGKKRNTFLESNRTSRFLAIRKADGLRPLPSCPGRGKVLLATDIAKYKAAKDLQMTSLVLADRSAEWRRLKALVVDTVSSPITKRVYSAHLDEFFAWYAQEPRPAAFTKATVMAWRVALEARGLRPISVNVRLTAVRKLAAEAADNGLLAPELAAGISRIKGVVAQGVRVGNWLTIQQAQALLNAPDATKAKGMRDRAILAVLLGCGAPRQRRSRSATFSSGTGADAPWTWPGKGSGSGRCPCRPGSRWRSIPGLPPPGSPTAPFSGL